LIVYGFNYTQLVDKIEEKLWKRVARFKWVFAFVPFLRTVAVCNSLSFGIVDEKSDIDLFVVAKKGRLFTARFFLTLALSLLGVRRHGKAVAGRFCLSFFVDESALGLSGLAIRKDFYLAYWVKKIVPVYGSRDVFLRFQESNKWTNGIVGGGVCGDGGESVAIYDGETFGAILVRKIIEILIWPFAFLTEPILRWWQIGRASSKLRELPDKRGTLIAKNMLKFHDFDKREFYRDLYIKKIGGGSFDESIFLNSLKSSQGLKENLEVK